MKLVFFLEEPSAKEMLKGIMSRLLPVDTDIKYVLFDGKQDLERQIEKKLKKWLLPDSKFIILRDQDSGDCLKIKKNLCDKCIKADKKDTLIRIACRELESWYLGDLSAVEKGLGLKGISSLQSNHKYRTPDNLINAKQELVLLTKKAYQEISGSRAISVHLKLDGSNSSYSFNVFIDGIKKIIG